MATTLVVYESPWTDRKGRFARWSMRPFVEGICELNHVRLIYRTFSTRSELTTLLGGEANWRQCSESRHRRAMAAERCRWSVAWLL